jgi:hypothetical protein
MQITTVELNKLEQCYEELLQLTERANNLLTMLGGADDIRAEYQTTGFVKVGSILFPDVLTTLLKSLSGILRPVAEEITMIHRLGPDEKLSDGSRFRRVDPECIQNSAARQKMTLLLEKLGLVDFGSQLALRLTPLIRHIVGLVSYRRIYLYDYEEGDYISAHNDSHIGDRVDIQFPVTLGTVAGVRILSNGFFLMHYDDAGSMNVLGPRVWHDVPPILAADPGVVPQRLNLGLRFRPD